MDRIVLQKGAHGSLEQGGCVMEFAAWVAGEPHSDHPSCVSPVIGEFLRWWNDALDDTDRQMLVPYAISAIGTKTGPADDETRAWLATDWLVRVQTPAWLRLAGLTAHASALESLARIVDAKTAQTAQPAIDAAGAAAGAAAWAAAGAAARKSLRPTVEVLQRSALGLLDAMIAVGRKEEPVHEDRAALVSLTLETRR